MTPTVIPRLQHNAEISADFIAKHNIFSRYPKVSEQVETEPLDLSGLKPHCYNPGLIEDRGFATIAYRYHYDGTLSTKLCIARLNPNGEVLSDGPLDVDGKSIEDPKLFLYRKELWVSFVTSNFPDMPPKCVVRFGRVVNGKIQEIVQPNIGKNDWSTMEKNWTFFVHRDQLYCVYRTHPQQEIYWLDGEPKAVHYTPTEPRWHYGPIKGGTAPVEYDGAYLRFFHSTLDNEFGQYRRRYFVGAYLMGKEPPFELLRVSKKPIIYGSEIDDLRVSQRPFHWKANVVFPGGATVQRYGWCLSLGLNDSACLLAKIRPENLNL